jgi:hypothetical protein
MTAVSGIMARARRAARHERKNMYTRIPPILPRASMVKRKTHVRSLAISAQSAVRREAISPLGVVSKKPISWSSIEPSRRSLRPRMMRCWATLKR